MAYNAPSTRSTGDLCTAAIWNADVVANAIAINAGALALASQAVGDILYASSTTQLGRIAAVATGQVLTSAGTGTVPAWSSNVDIGGTLDVAGAVTFNDAGADVDFRVESDGNANMLFVDGGSNAVVIGHSASDGQHRSLQILGTTSDTSGIELMRFSANAEGPSLAFTKSRGGAIGTEAIVQDDDALGSIVWFADDGTDQASYAASINAYVDGTPGSNDMPGRLVFSTTADGAASPTARMTIDASGVTITGAIAGATNTNLGKIKYFGVATLAGDGSATSTATDYTSSGATITVPSADVANCTKLIIMFNGSNRVNRYTSGGHAHADFRIQRTAPSAVDYKEHTIGSAVGSPGESLPTNQLTIFDESLGVGDHTYTMYFRKASGTDVYSGSIHYKHRDITMMAIGI